MHMTLDDGKNVVLMVTTMRPGEVVRVISYRRACDSERLQYYWLTKTLGQSISSEKP